MFIIANQAEGGGTPGQVSSKLKKKNHWVWRPGLRDVG